MTKGLDEILSGEAPAQVEPSTAPEPEKQEPEAQPRGPDGKFAPKEPSEPEPAPAEPPAPAPAAEKPSGVVPQQALHAAREKAKSAEERAADLERQLAELRGSVTTLVQQRQQPAPAPQPPPKPVDFWEDPNKFVEQSLTPVQQRLAEMTFRTSRAEAFVEFGKDAVAEAEAAIKQAVESGQIDGRTLEAQLSQSGDPVGDIVRWHQNSPSVREAKLREQIRAELQAELAGQQPAPLVEQPSTPAPQVMPSNLVGQRNVGTRSGPAWSGPAPLNDIFDRARPAKAG